MHALVTGGCGFIGSHLAEALLARGDRVTVVDDLSTGRLENVAHLAGRPGLATAIETIANEAAMDRLVSACDIVFHLAAAVGVELIVRDPVRVIETNVVGSATVLRVAARHGVKVVLASTSEVYGKSEAVPFAEDADRVLGPTTHGRWSYACSKAMDEFLALAYHQRDALPVVIARLFNTVGPRQTGRYGMVVPRLVRQALAGEPLTVYGDGGQSRCFCHVADVVRALVALGGEERAVGEVFNVGSTEEVTIRALAERVVALAGSRSKIVLVPYEEAYGAGFEDTRRRLPAIDKIAACLGWRPQATLDDILRDVIAYERGREETRQD